MGKSIALHQFFCIQCGNKTYDLMRKQGHKHERFHRKKLYCPWCKEDINCVECQNDEDVFDFKNDFMNGVFVNETEESLAVMRNSRQW